MNPALRVENVSKRYGLGAQVAGDLNLTETARRFARGTIQKFRALLRPGSQLDDSNSFWAVRDVSFEVRPGEAVGVIGRNGAGKSTLLKLISRITEPTQGRIEIRGRIGSLLEVGTGFHPELTGRENVYMNGSVLGMSRREIAAKFDRIVEFSEIGKFLDTPVKRYSSGMYVRLAFGVAAHLEPEILIVDEVLAVGDANFQKRCLDRMMELVRGGRTVLFVSHNMQQIPNLCQRAIMLDGGRLIESGSARAVTQSYLDRMLKDTRTGDLRAKPRTGDGRAKFVRAGLVDAEGRPVSVFTSGDDLVLHMDIESSVDLPDANILVAVQNLYGTRLVTGWTDESHFPIHLRKGRQGFECRIKNVTIRPTNSILVSLRLALANTTLIDAVDNAIACDVVGDARTQHLYANTDLGILAFDTEWKSVPPAE
ncbi:MAG: ABC transporter ATP-binding protein [Planctomycetia bacterium]|nr:ABC transporter ATP-binding protein [Planctomycetia bacterium]